jgi:hypothetical protein
MISIQAALTAAARVELGGCGEGGVVAVALHWALLW